MMLETIYWKKLCLHLLMVMFKWWVCSLMSSESLNIFLKIFGHLLMKIFPTNWTMTRTVQSSVQFSEHHLMNINYNLTVTNHNITPSSTVHQLSIGTWNVSFNSTRGPAVYQMWYTLAETGTPCTRTGTPWAKTGTHLTVIFEKSKVKICLKIQAAWMPKESEKII